MTFRHLQPGKSTWTGAFHCYVLHVKNNMEIMLGITTVA